MLFAELGVEFDQSAADLVIERFGQWGDSLTAAGPVRATICRADVLEAA
ncbi:hypothetical protein RAM_35320 [Amycolatopsis mediterranei S699]|uniref:Uncharacterized protein n=1 Tax=Amycolatopsis mediterranei (strain S699) TaxID=713604 RepID=A0A9R0P379_AMYMS|nr:hypothetical protein RAM_35320 [Amycolatopsis mediterranei S699]